MGTLLLLLLITSACVRDGEDPCPVGTTKLNLFVEKFQNVSENPLDATEEDFYNTVNHLQYYLYKDGEFLQKLELPTLSGSSKSHSLTLPDLFYGEYEIAIVANSTRTALEGNHTSCDNLLLQYQGCQNTEDYFTSMFSFTVDSEVEKEYNVGMLRTQGLVRYIFVNMPNFIDKFGIRVDDVYSTRRIKEGTYTGEWTVSRSFNVESTTADDDTYHIWAFPNRGDSIYPYIELFQQSDPDNPYFTASEEFFKDQKFKVRRNHLVDIISTYNNGTIDVEVKLDTKWDGPAPGGTGVLD